MSKRKKPQSEKPKKSLTAYVLYCGEKRSKLKEEQPDLTFAEVGKELGRLWRELSQDEKQPFSDKAKELKTEYDVAIKKYKEEHPDSSDDEKRSRKKRKTGKGKKGKKGKKGSRKKKDKNAPKRPKTGFMFFSQDMRSIVKQEKPDATFAETGKLLGERWGNASPEDRKVKNHNHYIFTTLLVILTFYTFEKQKSRNITINLKKIKKDTKKKWQTTHHQQKVHLPTPVVPNPILPPVIPTPPVAVRVKKRKNPLRKRNLKRKRLVANLNLIKLIIIHTYTKKKKNIQYLHTFIVNYFLF